MLTFLDENIDLTISRNTKHELPQFNYCAAVLAFQHPVCPQLDVMAKLVRAPASCVEGQKNHIPVESQINDLQNYLSLPTKLACSITWMAQELASSMSG